MAVKDFNRSDRVGDQIQRELATIIASQLDDPAGRNVTLSGVTVSKDLRNARVFVTTAQNDDREAALQSLNRAAGFLRRQLAARIRMKYLPRLQFRYDPTLDNAMHISALIDAARESDDAANSDDSTQG